VWNFVVDATPPLPLLTAPRSGEAVHETVSIQGRTADPRFKTGSLVFLPAGSTTATTIVDPVPNTSGAPLAAWDVRTLPDGDYDLQLSVIDSLGLVGVSQISVVVDNDFPPADRTTPARVNAATGGDVFTTNQEIHLYFPPRAFAEDATVTVDPVAVIGVPAGATPVGPGFSISSTAALDKTASLAWSWALVTPPPTGAPGLYRLNGSTWVPVGGTAHLAERRLDAPLSSPGTYALLVSGTTPTDTRPLGSLSLTPRVFSPSGTYGNTSIGIGFSLGRPGPVTVRVYDRSGRLIREVTRDQTFGSGSQLLSWDGRDRNGDLVLDGLYIVSVEALGETETHTLSVVR
jgi:hypothetical protein